MRKTSHWLLALGVLGILAACSGGGGGGTRIQGKLSSVEKYNITSLSSGQTQSLQMLQQMGVQGVNQLLRQRLGLQEDPVRGLNAVVLGEALAVSQSKKALFNTDEKKVAAVDQNGKIVASMDVDNQGNFEGDVPNGQNVALVVTSEEGGSTLCEEPLEVDPTPVSGGGDKTTVPSSKKNDNKLALFNFQGGTSATRLAAAKKVGLFGAHEDSGNPATAQSQTDTNSFKGDSGTQNQFKQDSDNDGTPNFVESCGDAANTARPKVKATFQWDIPGLSASGPGNTYDPDQAQQLMYDYALGLTLGMNDPDNPELLGAGTLNYRSEAGEGVGDFEIHTVKKKGNPKQMLSLMTDVGLFDPDKLGFPLMPTFHLEAAINPNNPLSSLTDNDFTYAGGQILADDMYHIYGTLPAPFALVLAVLDSPQIVAFNLAIANSTGNYRILVPAVPSSVAGYYFVAFDQAGNVYCYNNQLKYFFPPVPPGTDYGDANTLYIQASNWGACPSM